MTLKNVGVLAAIALIAVGCDPEAREGAGFRLPKGDVDQGKAAFVSLKCNTCHPVENVQLPAPASPGQHQVVLGGAVLKVKSYGQLVTAVIHPAHDIALGFDERKIEGASSPMPEFNSIMTVEQMIDIVTFLHSTYRQREIDYDYPPMGY